MRVLYCVSFFLIHAPLFSMILEEDTQRNEQDMFIEQFDCSMRHEVPTYGLMFFSQRNIEYGVSSERCSGEDRHSVVLDGHMPFFGVFDGHNGVTAAEHVKTTLYPILYNIYLANSVTKETIVNAFLQTQQSIPVIKHDKSGTTAIAVFFTTGPTPGQIVMHVAHVGDSRAVLGTRAQAFALTADHNTTNKQELERVSTAAKRTFSQAKWKSYSSVAVTRRIAQGRQIVGLNSVPDVISLTLSPEDRFVIIGSDGLWDQVSNEEANTIVNNLLYSGHIAKSASQHLVDIALARGKQTSKRDDITVIVVVFH